MLFFRFRLPSACRPASLLRWWAAPFGLSLAVSLVAADPGTDDPAARRWAQYAPSFQAFDEADQAQPPVRGGIVFVLLIFVLLGRD